MGGQPVQPHFQLPFLPRGLGVELIPASGSPEMETGRRGAGAGGVCWMGSRVPGGGHSPAGAVPSQPYLRSPLPRHFIRYLALGRVQWLILVIPALSEAKVGRSLEVRSSRLAQLTVKPRLYQKNKNYPGMVACGPLVLATWELSRRIT